ncbi:conjugal transfer protein [Paenibacillus alkaliterrae]|uniref:conjugal transfer protein n=1 Tax=Paenibacillus alkaliterrae TaxID=320909 RepID=UPI001F32C1F3|nr:conjugal transfer protein [Paenibacillus alkaliterrae]MCF2940549.1 conjugal transfer protein [Paenibacillus alkaliterrae]
MSFLKKKNKNNEVDPQAAEKASMKDEPKKKSDKSIKPRAPRASAGKKIIRTVFWTFLSLLLLKGAISFAQGTRVINQTTVYGNTETIVSDSVKGFATDFATEYFTWDANYTLDRNKRLEKFIKGIESDMGLKTVDVKSSSKVTSAEVYGTNVLDDKHIDITVVVWRTVTPLPDKLQAAKGKAGEPVIVTRKTYMVVPVTLAAEGPVIQAYPRFVSEQAKGETIDPASQGVAVGDSALIQKGTELADSYLRSWYEGNASQLKYFYADNVKAPESLIKSEFSYKNLNLVSMFSVPSPDGAGINYRIDANVLVNSDIGEPFNNSWSLTVNEKDGKLFVISNGINQPKKAPSDAETTDPEMDSEVMKEPASSETVPTDTQ